MVSRVVGVELVKCIFEYLLNFSKACVLASYTQVVGIQKPLGGLILMLVICVNFIEVQAHSPVADHCVAGDSVSLEIGYISLNIAIALANPGSSPRVRK